MKPINNRPILVLKYYTALPRPVRSASGGATALPRPLLAAPRLLLSVSRGRGGASSRRGGPRGEAVRRLRRERRRGGGRGRLPCAPSRVRARPPLACSPPPIHRLCPSPRARLRQPILTCLPPPVPTIASVRHSAASATSLSLSCAPLAHPSRSAAVCSRCQPPTSPSG